jgi:YVTN family beta-propeller protein
VRPPIPTGGYPHGIAVTPDGRDVVVANTISRNLSVIDATTDTVVATIQNAALQYPNDVLITR